jgi:hypothetical protein
VLTLANLAKSSNKTLHLSKPQLGATALPVEVGDADNPPDGSAGVSATASLTERGLAFTLINRHVKHDAEVCIETFVPGLAAAKARILTAAARNATSSADAPDCVPPADLAVSLRGRGICRVELPRHSPATLVLT